MYVLIIGKFFCNRSSLSQVTQSENPPSPHPKAFFRGQARRAL